MQWQGVNEFVAVAEEGSFTAAAKKLDLSTAQVSRQISQLESRLGVKLLYRTTRTVTITQEGSIYYQHCRAVLDGLQHAEDELLNLQSKPQGKIKLTATVTYGEQIVLPLINKFVMRYPDIEVEAYLTNKRVDLVEENYDLAIRIGDLEDSTMMARKLSKRSNYVCAAPEYLHKYGTPHTISELSNHNCLLGTLDHWRFVVEGREKSVKVKGNLRYNSGFGLTQAALNGIGIVQLPDYYTQDYITQGLLVPLLESYRIPVEGIWAVYPQNRFMSPKLRVLIDFLVENIQ
ncbi:LysR substrate-binding domain-containing protein [Kangiella spongicola]|uniref:LysR family transcriptional regulator n=1 Tax=Kangiella spongicola TaxID=796379 RepID=A0A318D1K9_9GAMM|nr:LysR substrate-binding domain-containing protein [Kangiella spongicola]PXF62683.1 LysR family transcriptional regulator [Kangiella spongicola]